MKGYKLFLIGIACLSATTCAQAGQNPGAVRADHLVKLARHYWSSLSQSEVAMLRAAATGGSAWRGIERVDTEDTAQLVDGDRPQNARQFDWENKRSIRANLIKWLATDPDATKLIHPHGIDVADAYLKGKLTMSNVSLTVPVELVACAIPDGVDLQMTHLPMLSLQRSVTGPIIANSLKVDGDLSLVDGVYESVSLNNSQIRGNVDASRTELLNNDMAASFRQAQITGSLIMMNMNTYGPVIIAAAEIGGNASFEGAQFAGASGLWADEANVKGSFNWTKVRKGPVTELELIGASVEEFDDDPQSWPDPHKLLISGFVYQQIDPDKKTMRLDWLSRSQGSQESQQSLFDLQPYDAFAKFLTSKGEKEEALDVEIEKRRISLGHRQTCPVGWIGTTMQCLGATIDYYFQEMLGATIEYGYRPLHAIYYIAIVVGFGFLVFLGGYVIGAITPTERDAYNAFLESKPRTLAPGYPRFNAFVYSLESFLPLVDLHQLKYWLPDSRAYKCTLPLLHHQVSAARWLRAYLWIHILAGWFFSTMLVAGLTGLVQK